jgi:hypothetical protein
MNADQLGISDLHRSKFPKLAISEPNSRVLGLDQHEMEQVLDEFSFLHPSPIGSLSELAREMRGLKHAVWSLVFLLIVIGLAASQLA